MTEKKTRSPRAPKPPTSYSGMNALMWRSDQTHLEWAQRHPIFGELVAVMHNGRAIVDSSYGKGDESEGRMLGRREGYDKALEILGSLAFGIPKTPTLPEPTYQRDDPEPPQPTD